jgi:hypothetical protein
LPSMSSELRGNPNPPMKFRVRKIRSEMLR